MTAKIFLFVSILISSLGFSQFNSTNLNWGKDSRKVIKSTHVSGSKNIKFYKIKANKSLAKAVNVKSNYHTLEKALLSKKLTIKEVSSSGTVNTLEVENKGKDTVMIMMGDVLKGGKQDRVVQEDYLIAPGKKKSISVFCVEQGRWSSDERGAAEFDTYHSNVSGDVKKVILKDKNQQAVWQKVDEINTKNKTTTSSGTYTAISENKDNKKTIEDLLAKFQKEFENEKDLVGLLAVTDDRIIGCEIFATNELMKSNLKNILKSFITDAVISGGPIKISDQEVKNYLSSLLDNEKTQETFIKDKGKTLKKAGRSVKLSVY